MEKVPFPVLFLSSDLNCGGGLNSQNTNTHSCGHNDQSKGMQKATHTTI